MVEITADTIRDIENELAWFTELLDLRLSNYFAVQKSDINIFSVIPPDLETSDSVYALFIKEYHLTAAERAVLILAMISHIRPQLLDVLWVRNNAIERGFLRSSAA